MRFPLDLPFKGKRQYLHSTDIFDALIDRFDIIGPVELTMRRFVHFPLVAVPTSEVSDPHDFPVHFCGQSASGRLDLVLGEDEQRAVERRISYDEEAIAAGSVIEGATITSTGTQGSSIERIVALNKRLISECTKPHGKLAFARLSFSYTPDRQSALVLKLESNIGTRLYRSSVHADGRLVGDVVFSGLSAG
jgi:hypothetical protein